MSPASVALVVVSHSARLAEGVAEVAAQMAPDVLIRAAGGIDGRIGTSFETVTAATEDLLATPGVGGVVLLTDLGSATLTAEAVLDVLDDPRAVLAEGPLVEGAVAGSVAAQVGGGVTDVVRAVAEAGRSPGAPAPRPVPERAEAAPSSVPSSGDAPQERTLYLSNRLGLHARPAAILARTAAAHDAEVTLNGVDAANVLEVMSLGLEAGAEMHLSARGPQAGGALEAIGRLVADAFGEA